METCTYGSGAGLERPTAAMPQGAPDRAYRLSQEFFRQKKLSHESTLLSEHVFD